MREFLKLLLAVVLGVIIGSAAYNFLAGFFASL